MTKRHLEQLAEGVRQYVRTSRVTHVQHRLLAQAIADICERHNPRFNRQKFLTACGVN
jgi:hypothetical protein